MSKPQKPHKEKQSILIFVDGASSGNPGPGGWGGIIAFPEGKIQEIGGYEPGTTNNRMELTGAIQALSSIKDPESPIQICTDSTYVIRGITQWIWGWFKKKWKNAEGKDIANVDLWKKLFAAVRDKDIEWNYVPGHSGIPGNERADEIAVAFSKRRP